MSVAYKHLKKKIKRKIFNLNIFKARPILLHSAEISVSAASPKTPPSLFTNMGGRTGRGILVISPIYVRVSHFAPLHSPSSSSPFPPTRLVLSQSVVLITCFCNYNFN